MKLIDKNGKELRYGDTILIHKAIESDLDLTGNTTMSVCFLEIKLEHFYTISVTKKKKGEIQGYIEYGKEGNTCRLLPEYLHKNTYRITNIQKITVWDIIVRFFSRFF